MPAKYLGVHMQSGKTLGTSVREAHKMGCTAIQVFTTSPRMWKSSPPTLEKTAEFRNAVRDTGIKHLISHDTYLVNLCHSEEDVIKKSFTTLLDEVNRCHNLGIGLVVSHIGALKSRTKKEGFDLIEQTLKLLLPEIPDDVTLLMETTAGQGSSVNSRFEEIAELLERCGGHPRLAVCMDTCHIFAAGYDIRTEEGYEKTIGEFDRLVGVNQIKAFHLNDSKKPFASRVDRHDNIGDGLIGRTPFGCLVNDERFQEVPMVVETPVENEGHQRDLATLRGLILN